jgi:hypothetical protein
MKHARRNLIPLAQAYATLPPTKKNKYKKICLICARKGSNLHWSRCILQLFYCYGLAVTFLPALIATALQ